MVQILSAYRLVQISQSRQAHGPSLNPEQRRIGVPANVGSNVLHFTSSAIDVAARRTALPDQMLYRNIILAVCPGAVDSI